MLSVDRLNRIYKRTNSPKKLSKLVTEEIFVRAWSRPICRSAYSIFAQNYFPHKWVFLVGCFNSGTTILQKMLNSHPGVSGIPREGVRFTKVLSDLEENGHHMIWDSDFHSYVEPLIADDVALKKIKEDWGIFWNPETSVFLDKSVANTARIKWLNRVFPNACFIGIHRNGYCVTEGLRRRAKPPEWYQRRYNSQQYTYESVGNQWVISNDLMQNSLSNMPNALTIRFEDLVANPLDTVRSCIEFLQLDTQFLSQIDKALYVNNKEFEIHDPNPASLERLGENGRLMSKPILEPMMIQLGYEV